MKKESTQKKTAQVERRLFVAIELSPSIRERVVKLVDSIKSSVKDVKWVEKENLHLTLKFLGAVEETKAATVEKALDETAQTIKKAAGSFFRHGFKVSFKGLGAFPRLTHPRVFWVGIDSGAIKLTEIAKAVEESLGKIGFPKEEKQFKAHLTIGRVRSGIPKLNLDPAVIANESFGEMEVKKLSLIQSTLGPKGAKHETLKEFQLA